MPIITYPPDDNPQELQKNGPTIDVEVHTSIPLAQLLKEQKKPIPKPTKGTALFDTGATHTCVDNSIINQLNIEPSEYIPIITPSGITNAPVFRVMLYFPLIKLSLDFSRAIGVDLSKIAVKEQNLLVLVGRDVLSRCVFIYNGPTGRYTFCC